MFTYRAILDVPRELVHFVSGKLLAHRRVIRTRCGTRALSSCGQALFVLVWFRERRDVALAGRRFGISQATAYRYLNEAIKVLAAQAPQLHEALQKVAADGWSHVILDGKVVASDRLAEPSTSKRGKVINAWNPGKTSGFGGNIQAITFLGSHRVSLGVGSALTCGDVSA